MNHGIPEELLERVKKVSSECYKLEREKIFKTSTPVKLLNELVENKSDNKIETVDWEDVFLLSDDAIESEWPSETPEFRYISSQKVPNTLYSTDVKYRLWE